MPYTTPRFPVFDDVDEERLHRKQRLAASFPAVRRKALDGPAQQRAGQRADHQAQNDRGTQHGPIEPAVSVPKCADLKALPER